MTRNFQDQHAATRMTAPTTASVAPPLLVFDPSNRNPTARTSDARGLTRMVARMVLQSRPNHAGVHTAAAIGSIPTVRTRIAERTHIIATRNSDDAEARPLRSWTKMALRLKCGSMGF